MKVEFLYTKDCHVWKQSMHLLERILKQHNIKTKIDLIEVKTQRDAIKHKFSGSLQINIDENDADPFVVKIRQYSLACCRNYFFQGNVYEFPPSAMILDAIRR